MNYGNVASINFPSPRKNFNLGLFLFSFAALRVSVTHIRTQRGFAQLRSLSRLGLCGVLECLTLETLQNLMRSGSNWKALEIYYVQSFEKYCFLQFCSNSLLKGFILNTLELLQFLITFFAWKSRKCYSVDLWTYLWMNSVSLWSHKKLHETYIFRLLESDRELM